MEYNITIVTSLFLMYLMYLFRFYTKLIVNKKERIKHQETNTKLDELRKIPIKTKEQQKEFIELKYGHHDFYKWTFKNVLKTILSAIPFIIIYIIFIKLWINYIQINIPFYAFILFMIIVPIIINLILRKFNMQKDDVTVFFRKY